jgi:Polyketide cyclase / dehydrase and lipid transport
VATSTNAVDIGAAPDAVFSVLDDACAYPRWVVGTRRIRHVDPEWPAEGARFHHAVGTAVAELHDWTRVCRRLSPHRLVLDVRFRPTGTARVQIDVTPTRTGSHVELRETPTDGLAARVPAALVVPALWARNRWSLQRLRHEVERQERTDDTTAS